MAARGNASLPIIVIPPGPLIVITTASASVMTWPFGAHIPEQVDLARDVMGQLLKNWPTAGGNTVYKGWWYWFQATWGHGRRPCVGPLSLLAWGSLRKRSGGSDSQCAVSWGMLGVATPGPIGVCDQAAEERGSTSKLVSCCNVSLGKCALAGVLGVMHQRL